MFWPNLHRLSHCACAERVHCASERFDAGEAERELARVDIMYMCCYRSAPISGQDQRSKAKFIDLIKSSRAPVMAAAHVDA